MSLRAPLVLLLLVVAVQPALGSRFWSSTTDQTVIINSTAYTTVDGITVLLNGSIYNAWFRVENSTGWEFRFTNSTNKFGLTRGISTTIRNNSTHNMIYDPTVILDGSIFKMWFVAENGTGSTEIFYTNSSTFSAPQGATWSPSQAVNVFNNSTELSIASPVVMLDSGTYKMWYQADNTSNTLIKYATSSDGLAWTQGGISLTDNDTEIWIDQPSVLLDTFDGVTQYKMYYRAIDVNGNISISFANSSDGVTWTRRGWTNVSNSTARIRVESPTVLRNNTTTEMWFLEEEASGGDFIVTFANQTNSLTPRTIISSATVNRGDKLTLTVEIYNVGRQAVTDLFTGPLNMTKTDVGNQNSTFTITANNSPIQTLAVGASATFNWTITPGTDSPLGLYNIQMVFRATGAGSEATVVNESVRLTVN
ncbi:hypothetical protein HYS54_01325, partial [Candidatus Micrarchaeota archaeon]|nr:hypothetical protein [Candidatus Micrarchaeota archaeon]